MKHNGIKRASVTVEYWSCGRSDCDRRHAHRISAQQCRDKAPKKKALNHAQRIVRALDVLRQVASGRRLSEIGADLGVSAGRAAELSQQGVRILKWRGGMPDCQYGVRWLRENRQAVAAATKVAEAKIPSGDLDLWFF